MGLAEGVQALIRALDDMRREQSDPNAQAVADALDAILLRQEPEAAPAPQLEHEPEPAP